MDWRSPAMDMNIKMTDTMLPAHEPGAPHRSATQVLVDSSGGQPSSCTRGARTVRFDRMNVARRSCGAMRCPSRCHWPLRTRRGFTIFDTHLRPGASGQDCLFLFSVSLSDTHRRGLPNAKPTPPMIRYAKLPRKRPHASPTPGKGARIAITSKRSGAGERDD